MNRNKEIIKTSVVGVISNLFLAVLKLIVGSATNSIAIRADAINNLTDSMSSFITIIGTRLSEKEPDRKHPFGYGRIEYLSTLLIGGLILYAGVSAALASVKRILHPQPNDYSLYAMLIVLAAVLVKITMGFYTIYKGKECESDALSASGKDAFNDSIASAATLVAAVLYVTMNIKIEAYVGLIISIVIIKTGLETLLETVSRLLGENVEPKLISDVKASILSFPEVTDAFDLIIHNYGKEKLIGSAHIEVPDVLRAGWVDNLQRSITEKVLEDTGVELLGVTIYALNSKDEEVIRMRRSVKDIVTEEKSVRAMNGFYLNKIDKVISFEVEIDFDSEKRSVIEDRIVAKVYKAYPEYGVDVKVKYYLEGLE